MADLPDQSDAYKSPGSCSPLCSSRYQKVHPVVGVEDGTAPGTAPAPAVQTRYGRVGGAICYDFDFPDFLRQASRGADLMLQPGWDWGPLGLLHANMDAVRAVENGVTVFRCSSGGVSGVYGPYGDVVLQKVTGKWKGTGYIADIPMRRQVVTVYSTVGHLGVYVCLGLWGAIMLGSVLTSPQTHQRLRRGSLLLTDSLRRLEPDPSATPPAGLQVPGDAVLA